MSNGIDWGMVVAWLMVLALFLWNLAMLCIQWGEKMQLEERLRVLEERKGNQ